MFRVLTLFILFLNGLAAGQPTPRHLERVAYDDPRNKLIVFGGSAMRDGRLEYDSNVYEWGIKKGWRVFVGSGPGPRNGGALVYHSGLKETILMGGVYENSRGYRILFDVWQWNGRRWRKSDTTCPVKEPEAVFASGMEKVLVCGEVTNKDRLVYSGDRQFELWSFDGREWRLESRQVPAIGGSLSMSFDQDRNCLMIPMAEGDKMVVYEWAGGLWEKRFSTRENPLARSRYSFAYDPMRHAAYLHGGRTDQKEFLNDLWQWDGRDWKNVTPKAPIDKKASSRMVYGKPGLVEFGGAVDRDNKTITVNEIWVLKNNTWSKY